MLVGLKDPAPILCPVTKSSFRVNPQPVIVSGIKLMHSQSLYEAGDVIGGRYKVFQVLMGGMGEVYLCLDHEAMSAFALKTFKARFFTDQKLREAFSAEAATWVGLGKHPNIVRCFFL